MSRLEGRVAIITGGYRGLGKTLCLAMAEEVGDVIVFLTSARASYVTGTSINIDGGTGRFLID